MEKTMSENEFIKKAEAYIEKFYPGKQILKHAECVYVDEDMAIIRDRTYGEKDEVFYCPVYKKGKTVTGKPDERLVQEIYPLERWFNEADMIEAVKIAEQARKDLLPIPTIIKSIGKEDNNIVVCPEFSYSWSADKNGIWKKDGKIKIEVKDDENGKI